MAEQDMARARVPNADVFVVDLVSGEIDGATLVESMWMGRELGAVRTLGCYWPADTRGELKSRSHYAAALVA